MKFTIKQFNEQFPTSDHCLEYFWRMHFADKPCHKCGMYDGFHKLDGRRAYQCQCGNQVHPLAGTPMHKSPTDLRTWFLAIFFMTNTRSGMSAKQFERISGVTYKCAWRIFKQVRIMMSEDESGKLLGDVEIDEAYIGPKPGRRSSVKGRDGEIIFGAVERGGRAKVKHVPWAGRALWPEIDAAVDKSANLYSDSYQAYKSLNKKGWNHERVDHLTHEWVRGAAHTQNIENLWSIMKPGLRAVYRHVDPKYLQFYANEYAFRYSNRKSETPMFQLVLAKVNKQ